MLRLYFPNFTIFRPDFICYNDFVTKHRIRASAIITKDGNIALIHRLNHHQEYWVLPGGGIERGETPQQAVTREVKEETGLDVISCTLAFYVNRFSEPEVDQPCFFCAASGGELTFTGPENQRDPQNLYFPEWVDVKTLPGMVIYPEMAKTQLLEIL